MGGLDGACLSYRSSCLLESALGEDLEISLFECLLNFCFFGRAQLFDTFSIQMEDESIKGSR